MTPNARRIRMNRSEAERPRTTENDLLIRRSRVRNPPGSYSYSGSRIRVREEIREVAPDSAADRRRQRERQNGQRIRDAKWVQRASGRTTCPIRHCRARLVEDIDRLGRLVVRCPQCDRRRQGICRDCPLPVEGSVGKSVRCTKCKARALKASGAKSRRNNRDAINRRNRARLKDPDAQARLSQYKRLYRLAHPEKVRQWKRRSALKGTDAKRARRRKKVPRGLRHTTRRCLTLGCARVVKGHQKKCAPCLSRARDTALAILAARHTGRDERPAREPLRRSA